MPIGGLHLNFTRLMMTTSRPSTFRVIYTRLAVSCSRSVKALQRLYPLSPNLVVRQRQILSGKVPYHSIKTDTTILLYLKEGRKPDRPTEITIDNHWNLIRKCWADVPAARPAADILSQDLKRFHLESEREHTLRRKAPQMQTADSEGLKRGRRKRIKLVVTEKVHLYLCLHCKRS